MVSLRHHQGGYIALLSVLIVGAVATAVSLTLLLSGTDNQRVALAEQQSAAARGLTNACAEEALQQIHDNTAFTGTNNLTINGNSCSYTVTNTGTSTRTITATSTIQSVVRKVAVYVTIGSSNISITSWQEVN